VATREDICVATREDFFMAMDNWDTFSVENLATGVAGDFAFTVELERLTRLVKGNEEAMTLRATQVYRHVDGDWKVIHRHGDLLTPYEEKW
jgi:ketosteroid isomerase-like protein